jgi:hypothetical protein
MIKVQFYGRGNTMIVKYRVKEDFEYSLLKEIGYSYSPIEGGYISKDAATIVIDNRRPYIGQILQFTQNGSEQHLKNIEELKIKGFLKD